MRTRLRRTGKRIALDEQPFDPCDREPGFDQREQRERDPGDQGEAGHPGRNTARMIGRG
jgi:hypothetical protein